MKIVFVVSSLNPGGSETQSVRLACQLKQRGHQVSVVLPNGPGRYGGKRLRMLLEAGVLYVSFLGHENQRLAIEEYLKLNGPDALSSVGYPLSLMAMELARVANVPVRALRFESAGYIRQQFPQDLDYETRCMGAATVYVGNSQAVIESLSAYPGVGAQPRVVVPNGFTAPSISLEMRRRARAFWGVDDETILIGLLANFRLDGLKNQEMLVRVVDRLRTLLRHTARRFRVVMVGNDAGYRTVIQGLLRQYYLDDVVRLCAPIDDLDLLAGWDIAVNCSRTEGSSNALLEAMAYGLPVVATRVGGNPELLAEAGLLVELDDDEWMATLLAELVKNSALRAMHGAAARQRVVQEHNWEKVSGQWLQLLTPA